MHSRGPFSLFLSGRSGTKMMEKLLSPYSQVDMHHEYMVHHIQPIAVRYQMGLAEEAEVRRVLFEAHAAAIHYSKHMLWGDASNKLSWIINILARTFPEASFVHLIRDGRKVTSSYFHKLGNECYDNASTEALARYVQSYPREVAPPPEKPYWWPQPPVDTAERRQFLKWGQFERIAYHWALCHRRIAEQLEDVPAHSQFFIRLEDLVSDINVAKQFLAFLGLSPTEEVLDTLSRPHNVNRPKDHLLTDEQTEVFWQIAGDTMKLFGYDERPEYVVNY